MTRSIVLRFPASCCDCGLPLSVGSSATWLGKGKVSCCSGAAAESDHGSASVRYYKPKAAAQPAKAPADNAFEAKPERIKLPPDIGHAISKGLPLQPHQADELAKLCPDAGLIITLRSGARFMCQAQDAPHLCRCISESMVDNITAVMGVQP